MTTAKRQYFSWILWLSLFALVFLLFASASFSFDGTTTRLSHYKTSRREIPSVLVEHFPTELPKKDVWYYFTPGPLQANPAMQLLLKPSAAEVDRIYDQLSQIAVEHYVGYNPERSDESDIEMRVGRFLMVFRSNGLDHQWPNGDDHYFVTYKGYGAEPAEAGVCINKERGTVVYYCDLGKQTSFE